MEKIVQNKWNNQMYAVLQFNCNNPNNKTVTMRKPSGEVFTIELKEYNFNYRELVNKYSTTIRK